MPDWVEFGVQTNVPDEGLREAPSRKTFTEYITVSPSGSVEVKVKVKVEPSSIDTSVMAFSAGGRFTLWTVMVTVLELESEWDVAIKTILKLVVGD